MTKNTQDNKWESFYQAGKTGWDRGSTSKNLLYWIEAGLLSPCRILVPGCGNGYEVITLAQKGFDVVAIDIASSAINNLQKALDSKNLSAELVLADFFTWEPVEQFDVIYEQTSLCALPPKEWGIYEEQLYKWLKPQGKVFAQFMQTGQEGGPPYHCSLNDMLNLFSNEKWEWSKEYTANAMGSDKRELLYILNKK